MNKALRIIALCEKKKNLLGKPRIQKETAPCDNCGTHTNKFYKDGIGGDICRSCAEQDNKQNESAPVPADEMTDFLTELGKLAKLVSDQETMDKVSHLFDRLDKPIARFIDNVIAGAAGAPNSASVMVALKAGEDKEGTEPRPALLAATDYCRAAIRKLK